MTDYITYDGVKKRSSVINARIPEGNSTAIGVDYPTEILWDDGTEILWDDGTTIQWSNTRETNYRVYHVRKRSSIIVAKKR